ncbi:MAG: hypothetical protein WAU28_05755 [Candidatus Moraniibacteriota bacterium]
MNSFLDLITSDSAGNFGSLLSGLAITIVVAAYYHQKSQKNARDFQERVTQTFYYGRKFKEYYEKFFFLHFYKYVQSIVIDRIPNEKFELTNHAGLKFTAGGATETVNQEATDFFLLMQELMYVLKQNRTVNFIDEEELGKIIKSYASQIKDFFSVLDIFIAQRRKQELQGWGHINENDFITLKSFFQNKYNFLK